MIAECRNIYWNSTTRSVQIGDFLYQNPSQTIPATAGYYSLNSNNSWALCDAEGLVLNTGICPNIFTSSFGYVGTNGNVGIASISGSICGFDGIQPETGTSSFVNPIIVMTPTPNYVSGTPGDWTWSRESSTYPNAFFGQLDFGITTFLNYVGGNSFAFFGSLATNATSLGFMDDVLVSPNTLQSTLPILQNQPYTFDIWFKTSTASSRNGVRSTLFSRKQQAQASFGQAGWTFEQNKYQAGDLAITMTPTTGGGTEVIVYTTNAYLGTAWKCLTVTIDGSNQASGVKMYVNGQLVPTAFTGTSIPNMQEPSGTSISPQIGNIDIGDPAKSDAYYVGRIGRIAMYNNNAGVTAVTNNYNFFSSSYTN